MDQAGKIIIKTVAALHPALTILDSAYEYFDRVRYSKKRCKSLLLRAERILRTIAEVMKDNDHDNTSAQDLGRLQKNFKFVRNTIRTQCHMSFVRSILKLDDVNAALEEGHQYLDDCLTCFQIRSHASLQKKQDEYHEDIKEIKEQCNKLAEDPNRMKRTLNVKSGDVNDVKLALQRELQRDKRDTPKREMIALCLSYLVQTTGKIDLSEHPRWLITTYEVTIDPKTELGSGGFGVVIPGEWRGLPVAVKRINNNNLQDLTREVETWYNLRHDHIVPCYGASLTANPPFIVLRYMENGDLLRYLRQNPSANRVKLVHEACLGMRYLHDEKIVHGDIKAVNVLVDDAGKACLTDFGLSFRAQKASSKRPKAVMGTPGYMAPEAIKGELTYASDVYSFGMLIYETFTLHSPLIEESASDIASGRAVLRQPGSNAAEHGLTSSMWQLLQSCISREASRRPTSSQVAARTVALVNTWNPSPPKLSVANVTSLNQHGSFLHANSISGQVGRSSPIGTAVSSDSWSHSSRSVMDQPDISPVRIWCHTTRNDAKMTLNSAGCPIVMESGYNVGHTCFPESAKLVRTSNNASSKPSFTLEVTYGTKKVQEILELSGTTIKYSGTLKTSEWRFGGDDVAQQWFRRFLQYAEASKPGDGKAAAVAPSGPSAAVEWKLRASEWRRAMKGCRQEANVVFAEQDVSPPDFTWHQCTAPPRNISPYPEPSSSLSAMIYVINGQDEKLRFIRTIELEGSSVARMSAIDEHHSPFQVVEERFNDESTAQVWFDLVTREYERSIDSGSVPGRLRGHTPSNSSNLSNR